MKIAFFLPALLEAQKLINEVKVPQYLNIEYPSFPPEMEDCDLELKYAIVEPNSGKKLSCTEK